MTLSAASALPLQLEKTDKKKREPNMPLAKYFKGKGQQVMSDMQDRYGAEDGKRAFYATANKTGMKPAEDKPAAKPKRRMTFGQRIGAKD